MEKITLIINTFALIFVLLVTSCELVPVEPPIVVPPVIEPVIKSYDIELLSVNMPSSAAIGDVINVSYTIRNNGPAAYVGSYIDMRFAVEENITAPLNTYAPDFLANSLGNGTQFLGVGAIWQHTEAIVVDTTYFLPPQRSAKERKNIVIIWPGAISNDINLLNHHDSNQLEVIW